MNLFINLSLIQKTSNWIRKNPLRLDISLILILKVIGLFLLWDFCVAPFMPQKEYARQSIEQLFTAEPIIKKK